MKDLTKGNIYKTFLLFAIPMVLSGILSQSYNIINTILAGKVIGDQALAAIGAVAPLNNFINSVFWGYGMGAGIYIGYLFGGYRLVDMKKAIVSNLTLVMSVLAVISALLIVFRYPIYAYLQVDPLVLEECNRYFVVITIAKLPIIFVSNCVSAFSAMGDSTFPFYMSIVSVVMNIAIAMLTVTQLGMGTEGLAVGSLVAGLIVSTAYIVRLTTYFKKKGLDDVKNPFSFGAIKATCRYSLLTVLQQSVMTFSSFLLSPMVNVIGGAASASIAVSARIQGMNETIYQNSSKTVGSYIAQCRGAKKYHLIKKGLFVGFLQSLLFVSPVLLTAIFAARPVAMIFYGADADMVSVNYTVQFLRYCMPFLVCNLVANLFHHFLRGIGYVKALFVTTLVGAIARLVLSFILIPRMGLLGYYVAMIAHWVFDGATGLFIYLRGKWKLRLEQEG